MGKNGTEGGAPTQPPTQEAQTHPLRHTHHPQHISAEHTCHSHRHKHIIPTADSTHTPLSTLKRRGALAHTPQLRPYPYTPLHHQGPPEGAARCGQGRSRAQPQGANWGCLQRSEEAPAPPGSLGGKCLCIDSPAAGSTSFNPEPPDPRQPNAAPGRQEVLHVWQKIH